MLGSLRRMFGKSPQEIMFQATSGGKFYHGMRGMGALVGLVDAFPTWQTIQASNWVKTLNSGTVTTADGHPATLQVVTNNVADAVTSIQWSKDNGTTAWKPFQLNATDSIWLRVRLKLLVAASGGLLVGLSNVATANIFGTSGSTGAIGSGITDFMGFHKPHGSATLNGVARASSTSTSQTLTGYALADDTYTTLDILIPDGTKEVLFFQDGVLAYTQTTTTNFSATSTQLTLTVALQTNTTTARTLTMQRIVPWQDAQAA